MILFHDDFTMGLDRWNRSCSAPGTVSTFYRAGRPACQFQLCSELGSRAELSLTRQQSQPADWSQPVCYAFDFFIPGNFGDDPRWRVLTQFHDSWDAPEEIRQAVNEQTWQRWYRSGIFMASPPPVALILYGSRLTLEVCERNRSEQPILSGSLADASLRKLCFARPQSLHKHRYELGQVQRGEWHHLQICARWSNSSITAKLEIGLDHQTVAVYCGPNVYNARGNHWKIGYYRHAEITDADCLFIANPSLRHAL